MRGSSVQTTLSLLCQILSFSSRRPHPVGLVCLMRKPHVVLSVAEPGMHDLWPCRDAIRHALVLCRSSVP